MKKESSMRWSISIALIVLLTACAGPVLNKRGELLPLATKGDAQAQYLLGQSYCCGYGAGTSTPKALDWFCRAALQGHGGAQYEMGRYYALRSNRAWRMKLRQDLIQAYMWYSLAALQATPLADAEREGLAMDMSALEISQAKQRIRKWKDLGC